MIADPENREHEYTDKLDDKLFPKSKRTEIFTYTGVYFDPIQPDPDRISIVDIAHALSNSCRYGGHCPRFYSVAEHSVLVWRLMKDAGHTPVECFAGLLHDAEEAYLPDIPTPIKRQFPDYVAAGDRLREVIFNHFGVEYVLYDKVRPFDQQAYEIERGRQREGFGTMRPQDAKTAFLNKFQAYWWMYGGNASNASKQPKGSTDVAVEVHTGSQG